MKHKKTLIGMLALLVVLTNGLLFLLFQKTADRVPQTVPAEPDVVSEEDTVPETPDGSDAASKEAAVPIRSDESDVFDIESMLLTMTLDEKIYQLLFVTPESLTNMGQVTSAGDTTKEALSARPVGGIIYFASNFENKEQTQTMLRNIQGYSKIPLFLAVDEEGGRVARLGSNPHMGVPHIPAMGTIGQSGDPQNAYDAGKTIGGALREIGFNVDFAPDADVLVNPDNTEIGDRSFGTDPRLVSDMVASLVDGLQSTGIAATLKHFPGHGATFTNSHVARTESVRTLEQMRDCELKPFIAGIEKGAHFIMVSHLTAVSVSDKPSTLSREIMTDLLRAELNFDGIIITDSFSMGAITNTYSPAQATVLALKAGADMILMPTDLQTAASGIAEAIQTGDLTEARIDESVRRILTVKEALGLF